MTRKKPDLPDSSQLYQQNQTRLTRTTTRHHAIMSSRPRIVLPQLILNRNCSGLPVLQISTKENQLYPLWHLPTRQSPSTMRGKIAIPKYSQIPSRNTLTATEAIRNIINHGQVTARYRKKGAPRSRLLFNTD